MAPLAETHSPIIVKPNETVIVKAEKIPHYELRTNPVKVASVDLYVTGDTGLSMGYKNSKKFKINKMTKLILAIMLIFFNFAHAQLQGSGKNHHQKL
jgi:hypothetical protein